ncbi:MAG: hypothetical protein FJW30_16695 [Acidobacteria bacterium]|nr:hypothetical protein [Acidobacteriota bacterium]
MNGYLDQFGVADARREKRNKRIVLSLVGLIISGGLLWYFFRDYKEEARLREFFSLLEKKDYKAGYGLWGCTDATPCRDYAFDKFLRDWGPESPASAVAQIRKGKVRSCAGSVIQQLTIRGEEVNLIVDRSTLTLGFSPWPVCNPRIKT